MAHVHIPSEIPIRYFQRSKAWDNIVVGMIVVGLASFILALKQDPDRAWQAYVSNWLFFTATAMGAMILTVATWITKAKWNWSVRRVSLAFVAFLPVSFVLMLPMLGLGESFFPWIAEMAQDPILQKKAAYLNRPFLVTRNLVGVIVLFGMSLYFAYLALRPDMEHAKAAGRDHAKESRTRWHERLSEGWLGQDAEEDRSYRRMTRMAPVFVIVYAVVLSIISFDWVMSLEPHWYSTMMGPWFFMGAFWGGITATAMSVTFLKTSEKDFDRAMGRSQLHDLGKLTFAFTVFWAYLFFAQYLVIWYGKLPTEQAWIIRRSAPPFGAWSLLLIILCFVIPFAGLIGRKAKMNPLMVQGIGFVTLAGLWLEKYLMVAPALYHDGPAVSLWWPLIGLMFLGLFIGSLRWFYATFPVMQLWQPKPDPEMVDAELVGQSAGVA
ncbi:MAG: hypothetical protein BMS9Abin29_1982 [Gemmatimonadota bacterium]|nr:MAG: hypothetical protein BMS9Abin29_1982 [Gemmatimonadota bacterium]